MTEEARARKRETAEIIFDARPMLAVFLVSCFDYWFSRFGFTLVVLVRSLLGIYEGESETKKRLVVGTWEG